MLTIDDFKTGREWRDSPWFLAPEYSPTFDEMGFPGPTLQQAAAALGRLFPPEVCRSLSQAPKGLWRAFSLYVGWPAIVEPLLQVGIDATAADRVVDRKLLDRLRQKDAFFDAAFELRVAANCARARLHVERIRESSEKAPDLRVRLPADEYEVEVKALRGAQLEQFAEQLFHELTWTVGTVPSFALELRGSWELTKRALRDLPQLMTQQPAIMRAFAEAAAELNRERRAGTYHAPPFGCILARESVQATMTNALVPEHDSAKKVRYAIGPIRKAAKQFSGKAPGIVVLGVWRSADLRELASEIQRDAKANPRLYRCCRMVVLVDSARVAGERFRSRPVYLAVQVHARRTLNKAELRLAAVLASEAGSIAMSLDTLGPPGAITLATARPERRLRHLASVPIAPGTTTTISIPADGRAPTVSTSNSRNP